jgi:GNAT superfamily N-acetyltransferase
VSVSLTRVGTVKDALVRPMRLEDVPVAEELSLAAYTDAERFEPPSLTPASPRHAPARAGQWIARTSHLLATDPEGCWVAEVDGQLVGFAVSFRRDLLWLLASYAVRSGLQGQGIGRPLLEAALSHSRGCLRGMFASSSDPKAYRVYRRAGFTLHPELHLSGVPDRSVIPVVEHVREGTPGDFDLMDSLDRQRRDAAHGPDHPLLATMYRLLVIDRGTGSGYAYVHESGAPQLLAASNRRTAARLLWEAIASAPAGAPLEIAHVTPANEWAADIGLEARLSVSTRGYLALRGMRPPTPYLPHSSLL